MKKLVFTAMLIMASMIGFAQIPQGAKTYEKNGKTYVEIKEKSSKKDYKPLGFWATYEGVDYVLVPDSTKKQGFSAHRVEISKD